MNKRTLRIARSGGLIAAFSLLTGLLLAASPVSSAFAASPHVRATAGTSSCASCHFVHKASPDSEFLGGPNAGVAITQSCLACHDGSDTEASNVVTGAIDSFGLPGGHAIGAGTAGTADITGCETCHVVHGASADARRIPAKQINGTAVSSAGKDLCLACHTSNADWFGPGYPSTSAPTRDATGYPVAGTWTGAATYESAFNAHRLIPEATRTVGVSEPVRREQGDCVYCHGAHGGSNDYDGLVTTYTVPSQATLAADTSQGSYAALCFTCHGGDRPSGFATTPVNIKQFATASGGNGGHSIVTSGGTLPVGSPLPCFECHNPHGSSRGNSSLLTDERGESLATTGAEGTRAFCFTCHTTSDNASGFDSVTGAYNVIPATDEVVGISRTGGVLRLPDTAGHTQGDLTSCYDCHGSDYGAGGTNVHNPGDGQVANFGSDLASVADGGTVTSATAEATATLEATASIDASVSVLATESPVSILTTESTLSILTTESALSTDTAAPLLLPELTAPFDLLASPDTTTTAFDLFTSLDSTVTADALIATESPLPEPLVLVP